MGDSDATKRSGVFRRIVSGLPKRAAVKELLEHVHEEMTATSPESLYPLRPSATPRPATTPRRRVGDRTEPTLDDVALARERIVEVRANDESPERTAAIAEAFVGIHPLDGERLAQEFPEDVANLAGVPTSIRMTANRALIDRRYERALAELDGAQRRLVSARLQLAREPQRRVRVRDPLAPYLEHVDRAIDEIAVLEQYRSTFRDYAGTEHERQFLTIVPSTWFHSGQVVEVFGDLTRATHVLIAVPGVNNGYRSFRDTREKSEALYRTLAAEHPEANVAVIEWMGYEVPDWLRSPLPFPAIRGGAELQRFAAALDLDPAVQVTVLGHSYGSVVVSEALRRGLPADRAIFTGSPGVRAPVAAALGIDPSRVFALAADRDFVVRLKWHGTNPSDALFGATLLAVEGRGHGSYFAPNSVAVRNIARVVLGRIDELVHAANPTVSPLPVLDR
jgi:hypothetical protein